MLINVFLIIWDVYDKDDMSNESGIVLYGKQNKWLKWKSQNKIYIVSTLLNCYGCIRLFSWV